MATEETSLFDWIFGKSGPSVSEVQQRVDEARRAGIEKGFDLCKTEVIQLLASRGDINAAKAVKRIRLCRR